MQSRISKLHLMEILKQGVLLLSLLAPLTLHAESNQKLAYRINPTAQAYAGMNQNTAQRGSTFLNSTYKDVTVPPHRVRPPIYQQNAPYYAQQGDVQYGYSYPNRPYPQHGYPQQNGVTVIYQQSLPTYTSGQSHSYSYVNGDTNSTIESTSYMLISDWRRYNLPDPAVGMHWIYQNGRYLQIANGQ